MGIPALWDIIKEQDHSVLIAQLAQDHFTKHGRPLRVAVDEADWRFNNLTQQQVYIIREKSNEPAFQGIEKSMFFRICHLLTFNIQLLFVFDGPRRPRKRGKQGQGKIDYEKRRLLQEVLRYMQIPYHEAPGEAEAECARLQQLGIVDAVFSQDSDSLMFGCDFLVRDDRVAKEKGNNNRSKENTKKSAKSFKVIRGRDIKQAHELDREGLVLFAMLAGGDYDTKGLEQCGPAMAMRAVKAGLGTALCACRTKDHCVAWRERLIDCLGARYRGFVPFDFPNIKTLEKYNRPTISTDEQLQNLRGLRNGWYQPFDELKLLEVTRSRFNIRGKRYMNWIGPVLLTRALATQSPSNDNAYDIRLVKTKPPKTDDQTIPEPLLRKLSFSPFGLTTLTQKDFEGERRGYWTSVATDSFEPDFRVEKIEIPSYLLENTLPADVLHPPPPSPKGKRKRADEKADSTAQSNLARKRKRKTAPRPENTPTSSTTSATNASKRNLARSASLSTSANYDVVDLVSDDEDLLPELLMPLSRTPLPTSREHQNPPPRSSHPPSARSDVSNVIDLDVDSEDEAEDLAEAIRMSLGGTCPADCIARPSVDAPVDEWNESLFLPTVPPVSGDSRTWISAASAANEMPLIPQPSEAPMVPSMTRQHARVPLPDMPNTTPQHTQTALSDPSDAAADLRAKRLLHFGNLTNKPAANMLLSPSASVKASARIQPRFHQNLAVAPPTVVAGERIECIDLTGD